MKRFTLKRITLLLVTSLTFLFSQSVLAQVQYIKLTPVDGMYSYGQTAEKPGSESFHKLVDVNPDTKWGAWFNPDLSDEGSYPINKGESANKMYIIVKAETPIVPEWYFLLTGNDTSASNGRNWASWKIYGGNFESDDQAVRDVTNFTGWTLIDEKIDEPIPDTGSTYYDTDFNKADGETAYQYYWIEITKSRKGKDVYMQMSEFGLGTSGNFKAYVKYLEELGTSTDEPVNYSMLANSGGNSGEGAVNLFDSDSGTKWCVGFSNGAYVVFKASRPMTPSYYFMTTANDTGTYSGRNWKTWKLYGMNAAKDEDVTRDSEGWVLLDTKSNVGTDQLPAANYTQALFNVSEENTTEYRYFKVEVEAIVSGGTMQMADFILGDQYTLALDAEALAKSAAKNYNPDIFADKALLDKMAELIEEIKTCSDAKKLGELNAAVDAQVIAINQSAANYDELNTVRNQALQLLAEENLKEAAATYVTSWISEDNAIAPNNEYPCGNYAYIKANRQLTGEQAIAEARRLSAYLLANVKKVDDPINPDKNTDFYTAIAGSHGFSGEESACLYDGNREGTKWCTNELPAWTVFKVSDDYEPIKPTYYGLVTGGDTYSYPGRNWKTWKIWGANFDSDEEATRESEKWVLIDNKVNIGSDILHTENKFESYIYLSEGCQQAYRYFKIEVTEAGSGDLIQMNEFTFYNQGNLNEQRETFLEEFADFSVDDFKPAYSNLINSYNEKYEEFLNTANAPDMMKCKNDLMELQGKIAKSNETYLNYDILIQDSIADMSIDSKSLSEWHEGYLSENVAPCAKYVRGTNKYIMEKNELDDAALEAEMTYLRRIYSAVENKTYVLLDGHTVGEWGDGFYGNLIDGSAKNEIENEGTPEEKVNKATKWGGMPDENGNTYIIFRTQDEMTPFFYALTTGNDTQSYPGRNWGTWYLYAANFAGDGEATKDAEGWVLIDARENVGKDRLRPLNAKPSYFGIDAEKQKDYLYYKVVVTKAFDGTAIQMNELELGDTQKFADVKEELKTEANDFETDVVAEQSLLDAYKAAIPGLDPPTTMEELFEANHVLEDLRDKITASAAMYEAFKNKVDEVQEYLNNTSLEESEALNKLTTYLNENLEASEVYPNGTYDYIYEAHVLNDSILAVEIESLKTMKLAALAAGYEEGLDITELIVNPTFAQAKQVVDADGKNVSGTKEAEGWKGYIYANGTNKEGTMSAAEFCNQQSKFNISQTLTNLKPGYYQVKLNAGFRPHNDINCFDYAAIAFANDTKTFVPVVREDMAPDSTQAWLGDTADKKIYNIDVYGPKNAEVDSVVVGYVIWGVQGTINAILNNRYEITLVGKVAEDGNLTIGLKNEGTLTGGDWLGAGNFRLTYLGEEANADVIAENAECNAARANTLINTYKAAASSTLTDFKKAPNFGAAQKASLANLANSTTIEQLIADGNFFEEINATKTAYYDLCYYVDASLRKWVDGGHDPNEVAETYFYAIGRSLDAGDYANVAAAEAAKAELLAKYPDYLDIEVATKVKNATYTELSDEDPFNYEFIPTPDKNVQIFFRTSTMYDELAKNQTILEFEYKSDVDLTSASISNLKSDGKQTESLETLEATSEYKKVSLNVKDLKFTKGDDVLLIFKTANNAKVNVRHMMFVNNPAKKGDANNDGEVNGMDVIAVYNMMLGNTEKTAAADVNGDGEVNGMDVIAIYNAMLGN